MNFQKIEGFLGGCLLIFEEAPGDFADVRNMVPVAYHGKVTEEAINPAGIVIPAIMKNRFPEFIPYIDTRYFRPEHVQSFGDYAAVGFRGVKVLYVPEYDEILNIAGWEKSFGRSLAQSEKMISDLMARCLEFNLPVLFHADLRRYGEFVSSLLSAYPGLKMNVPHFGSSRKEMARLLERHENCYTDFSSLLPFMMEAPDAYLGFIKEFSNRVLFGSDALLSTPGVLREYMEFIDTFLEGDVRERVVIHNYLRFHGIEIKQDDK